MNRLGFVLTLGAIAAVSATAIDICIPAIPEIGRMLGASPEAGAALVTGYLLGYGPGQLFWGPLSDRFGRIVCLYVALAGFIVTSIGCALAPSLDFLIVMRILQGATGGGAPVIARAIARDQGGGKETATLISTIMMLVGLGPLLGPLIGSGLLAIASWQAIFWFLALFGVALVLGAFLFLGERRRRETREGITAAQYVRRCLPLFRSPEFLLGIGISSSIFAGYAAILGAGAIVAQERYGIGPEAFGPVFAIAALSFVAGSALARYLLRRYEIEHVLLTGAVVAAASGLGFASFHASALPLTPFWGLLCLYTFAFGLVMPSSTAMALEPAGPIAGLASSLVGTVQAMVGAGSSVLVVSGLLGDSYRSLNLSIAAAGVAVLLLVLGHRRLAGARRPTGT
ncbi:MAG: Bcr/CflA family efflux MFS transporter [Pseudomonadota bacterium]